MPFEVVKDRFLRSYEVFNSAWAAYLRSKYLHICDSRSERARVRQHPFLNHARFSLWQSAMIDLCKVVQKSSNQKTNLHKTLDSLVLLMSEGELPEGIHKNAFSKCRSLLDDGVTAKTIRQISLLRNRVFAHSDDLDEIARDELSPYYRDIDNLIECCQVVFNILATDVFGITLSFRSVELDTTKWVVEKLAEREKELKRQVIADIEEIRKRMQSD